MYPLDRRPIAFHIQLLIFLVSISLWTLSDAIKIVSFLDQTVSLYLHFATSVIHEITSALGIYCFRFAMPPFRFVSPFPNTHLPARACNYDFEQQDNQERSLSNAIHDQTRNNKVQSGFVSCGDFEQVKQHFSWTREYYKVSGANLTLDRPHLWLSGKINSLISKYLKNR